MPLTLKRDEQIKSAHIYLQEVLISAFTQGQSFNKSNPPQKKKKEFCMYARKLICLN